MKIISKAKGLVLNSVAELLARSYYLTQICRRVVQAYDNDCNSDILNNGEFLLLKLIVTLRQNGTYFDVGANQGDWSAEVLGQGFQGRLIAVDPLPSNIARLKSRFSTPMFEPYRYAVSDTIGEANFFSNVDEFQSGTDSLYNMKQIGYDANVNVVKVKCTTLDKLAEELKVNKIDFLKMDIEGHEYFALKGGGSLLENGAIDFIQIEFGHAARAARIYLHDIVELAGKYAYDIYVIKPNGFMPLKFTPFTENRYSYVNFLLARKNVISELNDYLLENR